MEREEGKEFGSKDWFKELNNRVIFPAKIAFYYNKKYNLVTTKVVQSKAKVRNVRYEDIKPSELYGQCSPSAIIKVKEVFSTKEFHQELDDLRKEWNTEEY